MTAQSQIAAAMAQLVAVREDIMVDECTATRPANPGQTPELDPDTGLPVLPDGTEVYSGPCTVADPSSALQGNRTVSDDPGVPNKRILRLPNASAGLLPGDLVQITAAAVSPSLVGDRFVVVGEEERTYATYRRYIVRGAS